MAKKIQKKQIEDGVFVETKATYSAPTQDNEFVQKKYVDEEVAKKADISHTHSWTDITNKPRISVTLADTAISRTYTIGLTGANGSSGKLIIPKAVSWNDVTDKPTFPTLPSWVTQTKPTYDWSEIQNKPSLDFIPTSWNRINGKEIIKTNENNGWLYLDFENSFANGVYSGDKILRTDGQLQVGSEGSVFRTHKEQNNDSVIIGNKIRIKTGEDDSYIAFGNPNWTKLVYGEFAGIKIWNNVDNNKVVLAGGGVTNLSELKNENIKVGGRNVVLNSKPRISQTFSVYGEIKFYGLSQNLEVGETYILTFKNYKTEPLFYLWDAGWGNAQEIHKGVPFTPSLPYEKIFVHTKQVPFECDFEMLKLEKGNIATDWTPAPEDLENNLIEKTIANNEKVLESKDELPIKTRRNVLMNNSGSRINLETLGNELTVTTHSGWARVNSNGYKIQGKDDNFVLTAGGNSISKSELLSLPRGYDTSTSVVLPATTVNDTVFVKASITLGLENIPNKGSVSFLKTFDGGSVTFVCAGKNIIYTGDNSFNGKDGSTATVTIFENKCYIRIANV